MNGIIIVAIIWFILSTVLRAANKGNRSNNHKAAIEEQRRRRQAYEDAKGRVIVKERQSDQYYIKKDHPYDLTTVRSATKEIAAETEILIRDLSSVQPAMQIIETLPNTSVSLPIKDEKKIEVRNQRKKEEHLKQEHLKQGAFGYDQLVQGIIMAEILGPCRAKTRKSPRILG